MHTYWYLRSSMHAPHLKLSHKRDWDSILPENSRISSRGVQMRCTSSNHKVYFNLSNHSYRLPGSINNTKKTKDIFTGAYANPEVTTKILCCCREIVRSLRQISEEICLPISSHLLVSLFAKPVRLQLILLTITNWKHAIVWMSWNRY